jgi:hypothetical protein
MSSKLPGHWNFRNPPEVQGVEIGGAVTVRQATVTLTDAQIKALPTTPVELVVAPGVNKALVAVFGITTPSDGAVGYAIDDNAGCGIVYGADVPASLNDLLARRVVQTGFADGLIYTYSPGFRDLGVVTNTGLYLAAFNPAGGEDANEDFTGGDPANSMTVTVLYAVMEL